MVRGHDHAAIALNDMIWRMVTCYAELSGRAPSMTPAAAYGLLNGIFQQALLGHLAGRESALSGLTAQVENLMPLLLGPGDQRSSQ